MARARLAARKLKSRRLAVLGRGDEPKSLIVRRRAVGLVLLALAHTPSHLKYGGRMQGTVQIHGDLFSTES